MKHQFNLLPIKRINIIISIILVCSIAFSTGCINSNQYIDSADIKKTFEEDYEELKIIADFLLAQKYSSISIQRNQNYMVANFGEHFPFDNDEVENTVNSLFDKGYLYFYRSNNTVHFERWKKWMYHEYRSGFAYLNEDSCNLDIQFLIEQQEMSVAGWYYYEDDYNEWRSRNSTE